jgi:ribokinase
MADTGLDVVVVGSLNQDLVVRVPRHPVPGETVLGSDHFTGLGGKGANQAVAASRLGARVAMVGRVGTDAAGDAMLAGLAAAGVDAAGVARDSSLGSGLAVITVDDRAENAIVVSPGANSSLGPSDIESARVAIGSSAVLLAQLEVPVAAVERAADLAGGRVILNPAPAPAKPLPVELLADVDVLVPNRTELAALAEVEEPSEIRAVAAAIARLRFTGDVVVTLGAEGALLVAGGEIVHVAAPQVDVVDTTGAGDAFCGALAESLARGLTLEESVRWAAAAGAFAVTGLGAQGAIPTAADMRLLVGGG